MQKLKVATAKFISAPPKRRRIAGLKYFICETNAIIEVGVKIQSPRGKRKGVFNTQLITIDIPKGFICDSTSLPWAVDSAGDVHDYGYCVQGAKKGFDRKFWDKVFYHLMISIGMPKWRAKIRYLGVRTLGYLPYKKRRQEKYQTLRMHAVSGIIEKWGV